jgi:SAM-dependent methyltransferase
MAVDHYAPHRHVEDLADCYFYHTIDLPGFGVQRGEWDLRPTIDHYLGDVDYRGKRVLDVGTANGILCFEMERRGANVVGYDLSLHHEWDAVPYDAQLPLQKLEEAKVHIDRLNNAWWLARRLLNSEARVVYGQVYAIPQDLEPFDIAMFGSILLHVRDPFLALQRAAALTRECIVVTDRYAPATRFIPDTSDPQLHTWWHYSPDLIVQFLRVLGFPHATVSRHSQKYEVTGEMIEQFTVVARAR